MSLEASIRRLEEQGHRIRRAQHWGQYRYQPAFGIAIRRDFASDRHKAC